MNKVLFVFCVAVSMTLLSGCSGGGSTPTADEYRELLKSYADRQGKNGGFVVDINKKVDQFKMLPDAEKRKRFNALKGGM